MFLGVRGQNKHLTEKFCLQGQMHSRIDQWERQLFLDCLALGCIRHRRSSTMYSASVLLGQAFLLHCLSTEFGSGLTTADERYQDWCKCSAVVYLWLLHDMSLPYLWHTFFAGATYHGGMQTRAGCAQHRIPLRYCALTGRAFQDTRSLLVTCLEGLTSIH